LEDIQVSEGRFCTVAKNIQLKVFDNRVFFWFHSGDTEHYPMANKVVYHNL